MPCELSHPDAAHIAVDDTKDDRNRMVVFCIQRLLIAGRHRLWLRLRRYLIVFDPLTFVLD